MEKAVIYNIRCPKTNEVIYIGQTVNLKRRISCHISNHTQSSPIARYIFILKRDGLLPLFEIIAACKFEDRHYIESKYIKQYAKKGILLLNKSDNMLNGCNFDKAHLKYFGCGAHLDKHTILNFKLSA